MPEPVIVAVGVSDEVKKPASKPDIVIDTIYEPDPARPVKQPKASKATPIVSAMLSGISKQPTVSHHPQCKCAVCKP